MKKIYTAPSVQILAINTKNHMLEGSGGEVGFGGGTLSDGNGSTLSKGGTLWDFDDDEDEI